MMSRNNTNNMGSNQTDKDSNMDACEDITHRISNDESDDCSELSRQAEDEDTMEDQPSEGSTSTSLPTESSCISTASDSVGGLLPLGLLAALPSSPRARETTVTPTKAGRYDLLLDILDEVERIIACDDEEDFITDFGSSNHLFFQEQ